MTQVKKLGNHAIVIGGSISGLLAGRVLAGHFEQVTVLERDTLPDGPEYRKGAPQARHVHALLTRGGQIMEELFPGLYLQLKEAGAVVADQARDAQMYMYGRYKERYESGFMIYGQSRPLLEYLIRSRLSLVPNVTIRDNVSVDGLITTADKRRVVGVEVGGERLQADLVVDAAGRGTRAPQWLKELGYGEVPVSTLKVDLMYASRIYKEPTPAPDWKILSVVSAAPALRNGGITPLEGGRWMVTMWGYFGDHPPADPEGFEAWAKTLEMPDLYNAIKSAEPLSPVESFKFPHHLRRHYERLERYPEGLAVLGDAVTSFNPIYGQGMTTGALGVKELQACLRDQASDVSGLADKFRKRLAAVVEAPWQLSTGSDMGYPQAEGKQGLAARLAAQYTRKLVDLTAVDRQLNGLFMQVMHMLKPATVLFSPGVVLKVLLSKRPATLGK